MKPAPLRHPQLLNPPSICPQCGNKAWERTSPDDAGEFFRLDDDPIEWVKDTKTYRCKFRILPEGAEVY